MMSFILFILRHRENTSFLHRAKARYHFRGPKKKQVRCRETMIQYWNIFVSNFKKEPLVSYKSEQWLRKGGDRPSLHAFSPMKNFSPHSTPSCYEPPNIIFSPKSCGEDRI